MKRDLNFHPLGKAFSTGLDKTAVGYQEEGVLKLLKDIGDGLAGNVNRSNNRPDTITMMIDQTDLMMGLMMKMETIMPICLI